MRSSSSRALPLTSSRPACCRSLYNTIIIVRILLTWFPSAPQAIAGPLRCCAIRIRHCLTLLHSCICIWHLHLWQADLHSPHMQSGQETPDNSVSG